MNDSQKEVVLLWLMMTSRQDYNPNNPLITSPDDILNGIATEYNANPPGGNWNWDNLTPAVARQVAQAGMNQDAQFDIVNTTFQNNAAGPWPGGGDHPRVAEVKGALGM